MNQTDSMSDAGAIAAAIFFGAVIFSIGIILFTFGLFPNLVVYLQHIRWVNEDHVADNALYWTFVFAWLLGAIGAAKFTKS